MRNCVDIAVSKPTFRCLHAVLCCGWRCRESFGKRSIAELPRHPPPLHIHTTRCLETRLPTHHLSFVHSKETGVLLSASTSFLPISYTDDHNFFAGLASCRSPDSTHPRERSREI